MPPEMHSMLRKFYMLILNGVTEAAPNSVKLIILSTVYKAKQSI